MKRSDVSDRQALEAVRPIGELAPLDGLADYENGSALQRLQHAGVPFKVALRKLEQLDDRGLIEYGVSLNYPWRTEKGEAELARLIAEDAPDLQRKAKLWERRLVSGHGALQADGFAQYEPLVFMLAGPIKHWWDENWMTPAHVRYDEWRTKVSERLVIEGHLVYRPHEAFKGHWSETAQAINDAVILACGVFIDLTPPGVPAEGTQAERELARQRKKLILELPPPRTPAYDDEQLDELAVMIGQANAL